jgi:hypothetical protein
VHVGATGEQSFVAVPHHGLPHVGWRGSAVSEVHTVVWAGVLTACVTRVDKTGVHAVDIPVPDGRLWL